MRAQREESVWNGRPLPMVRQPYPDELISSWLARVASAYGATWGTLCRDNGFPHAVDHDNRPEVFLGLENLTRVPRQTIEALDLAKRFPGQPLHRFSCHAETRRAVVDFCEDCFLEDIEDGRDNYMRYQWAIGGVAHCHKHRRLLATACGRCFQDLDGYWGTSKSGAHICCKSCRQRVAYASYRKKAGGAARLEFSLRSEQRLIEALGGSNKERRRLRVTEDLAFLAFIANFRDWGRWIKERMCAPVGIPKGAITPALDYDYGRHSSAILYPLSGLASSRRSELLGWVMCYLEQRDKRQQRYLLASLDVEPTARGLFRVLDNAGREEFVCRASRWPEILRGPVREVMYMA